MDYYKYYKSDFRLLVNIDTKYKGEDDSIVALDTSAAFNFRFWTTDRENPLICSSTGGNEPVLTNCTILDGQKVMCHFDRAVRELAPGRLMLEAEFVVPDTDFEGDNINNIKRLYTTSLVLTADPDKDSEGDHTYIPLLIDLVQGRDGKSAYQAAVEEGYTGTEGEFNEGMYNVASAAHKVVNFEGALTGTSPILDFDEETEYGTDASQVHYCYKEGLLYAAKATHTGAWDASHFEQIAIIEMVAPAQENVLIELKKDDGTPVAEVNVEVEIEDEQEARVLTTDSNGKATTSVVRGLLYTVKFPSVVGYVDVADMQRQAVVAQRTLVAEYKAIVAPGAERVTVQVAYTTAGDTAAEFTVTYDDTTLTVAIDSETNTGTFTVPSGSTFEVTMPDVGGYRTPSPVKMVAEEGEDVTITRLYHPYIEGGIFWKMKDGSVRELAGITRADYDNDRIFGLVFAVSTLEESGNSFVIPMRYLLSNFGRGNWLSANELVTTMSQCNNQTLAITDLDGEGNCQKLREWCESNNRTSSVAQATYNLIFEVDGVEYHAFTPAFGQLWVYSQNYTSINNIFSSITGATLFNINLGFWRSSSQYNEAWTNTLKNGSHYVEYDARKSADENNIMPVLAY